MELNPNFAKLMIAHKKDDGAISEPAVFFKI